MAFRITPFTDQNSTYQSIRTHSYE